MSARKLHFTRLDLLQDNFEESSIRGALYDIRKMTEGVGKPEKVMELVSRLRRESRERMCVNCWYSGNNQSKAMWCLYCHGRNGVAIQTTYSELVNLVSDDERLFGGEVTYKTTPFADH